MSIRLLQKRVGQREDPVPSLLYAMYTSLLVNIHCVLLFTRGRPIFTVHHHFPRNIPGQTVQGAIEYSPEVRYLRS